MTQPPPLPPSPARVRLILNADDFGLTRGINRGVAELHAAGVLTSATLMATGAAFADAASIARAHPTLGVGCHIVLVDGIPVSPPDRIPTLLGKDRRGFRSSLVDFLQALLRGQIREEEIVLEATAQMQRLQRAGIDVTHFDTHKHTHLFPAVARPLLHAADRCEVRAFRYPFEPNNLGPRMLGGIGRTPISLVRALAVGLTRPLQPAFRKLASLEADETTTAGTFGISATGSLNSKTLDALLTGLCVAGSSDAAYELCCHPGYNDADLDRVPTRLRASREREREALLTVVPRILEHRFAPRLIHYGDLGIAGHQRAVGHFTPNPGL